MTRCGCGRRLWFHERVAHPQTMCRLCALRRGIVRICDRDVFARIAAEAARRERFWAWTVYLHWAMTWTYDELLRA